MKKSKSYQDISFSASAVTQIDKAFRVLVAGRRKKIRYSTLEVEIDSARWKFDKFEEFIAGSLGGQVHLTAHSADGVLGFSYQRHPPPFGFTSISVEAPTRPD